MKTKCIKQSYKYGYKSALSRIRREKRFRGELIHRLINLKSHGIDIYTHERQQLVWILRGNKEWNGDVLNHFRRLYRRYDRPYDFRPQYGNRYGDEAVTFLTVDDLPF